SVVLAFASEDDARRLLAGGGAYLFNRFSKASIYVDIPPLHPCEHCWRYDHPTHHCKQPVVCCFCGAKHHTSAHKCDMCNATTDCEHHPAHC
ncbi:hypothetical protein BKA93DRAFT_698169, partial [Sparassis latifolia]